MTAGWEGYWLAGWLAGKPGRLPSPSEPITLFPVLHLIYAHNEIPG